MSDATAIWEPGTPPDRADDVDRTAYWESPYAGSYRRPALPGEWDGIPPTPTATLWVHVVPVHGPDDDLEFVRRPYWHEDER